MPLPRVRPSVALETVTGGRSGKPLKIKVARVGKRDRWCGIVLASNNAPLAEGEARTSAEIARADAIAAAVRL